jgi:hypothetical protein
MAKANYLCCDECDNKVIYDGYNRIIDEIASHLNVSEDDSWKISILCSDCTEDNSIRIRYKDE